VTFATQKDWMDLTIHNPSGTLLKVRVITVDLLRNETATEVYFVQEEDLHLTF
jgi:hypothetical protein